MTIDLNNAEQQREGGLIPEGTIVLVHMILNKVRKFRRGRLAQAEQEWREQRRRDVERIPSRVRLPSCKFWGLLTPLEGTTEGHQKAADISASRLRAILESARGIRPDDESEPAKAGRRMNGWGDFDGIRFIAKIGIEKAKEGSGFKDKNSLEAAITPDRKAWVKVEQAGRRPQLRRRSLRSALPPRRSRRRPATASRSRRGHPDMTGAVQRLRAIEAEWMAKATRSAIDAARSVITENDISGRAMIGSLNELEWGWIAMASVFAWIKTKSEQAVAEGVGYDQTIRAMQQCWRRSRGTPAR